MGVGAASTAARCSAARASVTGMVVVSPWSSACSSAEITAPASRSIACSGLYARLRAAIFQLGDLGIWVSRALPIRVGRRLVHFQPPAAARPAEPRLIRPALAVGD